MESNSIVASMSKNKKQSVARHASYNNKSSDSGPSFFSRPGLESMTDDDTFRMHGERDLWFEYSSRE